MSMVKKGISGSGDVMTSDEVVFCNNCQKVILTSQLKDNKCPFCSELIKEKESENND